MTCTNFPSAGLVIGVTTHQVGEIIYLWSGVVWEAIAPPLELANDLSQAWEFQTRPLMEESIIIFPPGKLLHVIETDADYVVTSGATPNVSSPDLTTGLHAHLQIYNNQVTLLQLGAAEDASGDGVEAGTTDDTAYWQYAKTLGIDVIVSRKSMISASIAGNTSSFKGVLSEYISQVVINPTVNSNNWFDHLDVSNISFYKLGFIGNGLGSGGGLAGAIRFQTSANSVRNLSVTHCYFQNFNQNYWVYFNNVISSFEMNKVTASDNVFVSMSGNDIDPTFSGVPACCIGFQGSYSDKAGKIKNLEANRNRMSCLYIKQGIAVWANCHGGEIAHNNIEDNGQHASGQDDASNYAIIMYTNRFLFGTPDYDYDPSGIESHNNTIVNPRDCGYYLQGLVESSIYSNNISGQTSTADASIPKGAIASNGCHSVDIYSNTMKNNVFDLALACVNYKNDRDITVRAYSNDCLSNTAATVKISPNGSVGEGYKSTLYATDNVVKGSIFVPFALASENFTCHIKGGEVSESALNGINFFTSVTPTPPAAKPLVFTIDGVDIHDIAQDALTLSAIDYTITTIKNCRFDMGSVLRYGLNLASTKNVSWFNNEFWTSVIPLAGDYCVNVTTSETLSLNNTTEGIPSSNKQVGFAAPTWSAEENDRVQSLRSSAQGGNYVLQGYVYDGAAWREQRMLYADVT